MSNSVNLRPQAKTVLSHLNRGKELSPAQARSRYGIACLSRSISEIRAAGVNVKTREKRDGSGVMYFI